MLHLYIFMLQMSCFIVAAEHPTEKFPLDVRTLASRIILYWFGSNYYTSPAFNKRRRYTLLDVDQLDTNGNTVQRRAGV